MIYGNSKTVTYPVHVVSVHVVEQQWCGTTIISRRYRNVTEIVAKRYQSQLSRLKIFLDDNVVNYLLGVVVRQLWGKRLWPKRAEYN